MFSVLDTDTTDHYHALKTPPCPQSARLNHGSIRTLDEPCDNLRVDQIYNIGCRSKM